MAQLVGVMNILLVGVMFAEAGTADVIAIDRQQELIERMRDDVPMADTVVQAGDVPLLLGDDNAVGSFPTK